MKKLLRYNFLFAILFSITFLLSACGSQTTEEGGSVTIQSSPFSEIKTIAARVKAYLEIGGKTCEFELDPDDTTLKDNQKCTDIPMGSHSYKIVYKYTETGVILANTEGTITLISGKDNEIYLAPPEKDIDDDGDGFKNFYEILQGTDPKDPGLKPVEDKTPPAVSTTSPANNSTNVPVNSKISATFSEAIDSKTIKNETFTVSNGSINILGTVAINGTTATFTPTGNLSYNTTYTALINTGVKDLAGNTIAGNYSWSFTTEISSGTKPSAPTGVTAQAGDTQITISWNAISGATSYNIYWSITAGVTKTTGTKISGGASTSYNHIGLTNGTAYYYVVTAVNDKGESVESSEVHTTPTNSSVSTNSIQLPKTGQTTCYDSSGSVIACAGTGQDGELQKGVAWPDPRFTDNGDGTVTDKLTGLAWTKDGNAPGPATCNPGGTRTWQAAINYVACLNTNSYLGYTDWRLPNINELKSLVHAGKSDTAAWLNTQGFSKVQQSDMYWSSTTYSVNTVNAWVVSMWDGDMDPGCKTCSGYVLPVRFGQSWLLENSAISIPKTGQVTCYNTTGNVVTCVGTGQDGEVQKGIVWPSPRFTDNGDSTVTDNLSGLVWTKDGNAPGPAVCSPAVTKTWQASQDYVACLNANSYLGYTDWRLPNINELKSLMHAGQSNEASWLNTQGFNNVQSNNYWSSTSSAFSSSIAWGISMGYGRMYVDNKSIVNVYAWPVRSGQ